MTTLEQVQARTWCPELQRYRCIHRTRAGTRCTLRPVKGCTVCHKHGGKAPQVREGGRRRMTAHEALQWAKEQAASLELPPCDDPRAHLETLLEISAREYAVASLAVDRLAESDSLVVVSSKGEAAAHPYVAEKARAAEQWRRVAKNAMDAGIAQSRVALEQAKAEHAMRALDVALEGLPPTERAERLQAFARALREPGSARQGLPAPR